MNWKFTSLYPVALALVHKDYQRFRFCHAGHPFWMFYRQRKNQSLTLLEDFSAGRYPVQIILLTCKDSGINGPTGGKDSMHL